MPLGLISRRTKLCALALLTAAVTAAHGTAASAEALLLVEADSGRVLHAENATYPWYPASLTKLMTAYVALRAVKEGRVSLSSMVTMSERAHAQQPSKMGFKPGTEFTVDNAIKMVMVKSANDIAVALGESISGSVENFAAEMNAAAQRLGMTQSNFANPNGLPDSAQVTSARDLAILARALMHEFPEHGLYWRIPAIKFGKRLMRNHNKLVDRYPGTDGMKTGFICASGFNLVATATRRGRRLIAVVLGAPSSPVRNEKAARLLESGFTNGGPLSWLTPSLGHVNSLTPISAAPPNLYDGTCGPNRRRPAVEAEEDEVAHSGDGQNGFSISSLQPAKPVSLIGPLVPSMPPIVVTIGRPKPPKPAIAAMPAPSDAVQSTTFNNTSLAGNPPAAFAPTKKTDAKPVPKPRPRKTTRAKSKKRR